MPVPLVPLVIRPSDPGGWIKWIRSYVFPRSTLPEVETVDEPIKALADEATRETNRYRKMSAFWGIAHITFGLPAVVLGAVAGTVVLTSPSWTVPAAILSLVGAAFAAGLIFLGGEARQKRAESRHDTWNEYEADCLLALVSVKGENSDPAQNMAALKGLIEKRRDIIAGKRANAA